MSNPVITITMKNGDVMKGELYPEIAPSHSGIYDPGRMPGRNRNGWSGILHQGRIRTERFRQ